MDILVLTAQKYNFKDDSSLGGNTYELRSRSQSHFSAACQSVGTVRKLQRWRVVKSSLTEESGLNMCTKHEGGTLRRILRVENNKGEVRGLAVQVRSTSNSNFSSPKGRLLKHI